MDTNIVSFLIKADTRAEAYAPFLEGKVLAISFMTVAELFQWAEINRWGERRKIELEEALRLDYLMLPYHANVCKEWGRVRAVARSSGQPISVQDAWIAATAIHFQIPLVTHNPSDFKCIDELILMTTLTNF
ncbi:type II toxin-antitoxin system VapC family toxin [Myxococcota bacterium]|nr:type II toxin-antitoxin system VapC family toxin [Myxococcota bacterium]